MYMGAPYQHFFNNSAVCCLRVQLINAYSAHELVWHAAAMLSKLSSATDVAHVLLQPVTAYIIINGTKQQ